MYTTWSYHFYFLQQESPNAPMKSPPRLWVDFDKTPTPTDKYGK